MEPLQFTNPIIRYVVMLWSVVALLLPIAIVFLFKKRFSDDRSIFFRAALAAVPLSFFLGIVMVMLSFALALLNVQAFNIFSTGASVAAFFDLSYYSVFSLWYVFWYLAALPLALIIGLKQSFRANITKTTTVMSLVVFVVFFAGVIGINRLRDYYKYCPSTVICKRYTNVYTYKPVPVPTTSTKPVDASQQKGVYVKPTITNIVDGQVLTFENGFLVVKGTATANDGVYLTAGFKSIEDFRFGREMGTLNLEAVKSDANGNYVIRIEENMIPKGTVNLAIWTSTDSDVPWASVYNAAIVTVVHK